jgi:signal peptidase I
MSSAAVVLDHSPADSPGGDQSERRLGIVLAWARLILYVLGRGYRAFFLTLVVVAMAPTLLGWSSYVVRSGSMEPSIAVGDVVAAKPFSSSDEVPVGRVVIFPNPAKPGEDELLVHRVVENLGTGEYATAGDANATNDATPITAEDLRARARLLVPLVGRPLVWLEHGRVVPLVFWGALTTLLFVGATSRPGQGGRSGGGTASGRRRGLRVRRRVGGVVPALALLVAGGVAITGTHTATAGFASRTTSGSNTWQVAAAIPKPYTAQVLADGPYAYYQVDEASGPTMADSSGNARIGTYSSIGTYRQNGALPNNPGTSVALNGGNGRMISGGPTVAGPGTYSLELWFRTSTTAGGKLIGFESTRNATSPSFDRHVFMRPDGRLVYGGWSDILLGTATVLSPSAYNNGGWHHLLVTAKPRGLGLLRQDAVMYVDGAAVASGPATLPRSYDGWWRVGHGSLATGSGYPASASFTGSIDQVAIYHSALTATRVQSHWAAR